MIGTFALLALQAGDPIVPVMDDAPAAVIWAGYDQCLGREVDLRSEGSGSPEAIFDASHQACKFWMDAYFAKIQQNVIVTNVDYEKERSKLLEAVREKVIPIIVERQSKAQEMEPRS